MPYIEYGDRKKGNILKYHAYQLILLVSRLSLIFVRIEKKIWPYKAFFVNFFISSIVLFQVPFVLLVLLMKYCFLFVFAPV